MICRFVTKLERVKVSDLRSAEFIQNIGAVLPDTLKAEQLDIVGLARLEINDKLENKGLFQEVSIRATLPCRPDNGTDKWAYIATDDMGQRTLIGSSVRPYAVSLFTDTHPDSPSSKAAVQLDVQYRGWSVLRVIE